MCDFSARLIAWLDQELPEEQAVDVEQHLTACAECRAHVEKYRRVSSTFDAYCEAAAASRAPRKLPLWVPVLSGAVAATAALLLVFSRVRVERPSVHPQTAAAPTAVVSEPIPVSAKSIHRRHSAAPAQSQAATWAAGEPSIEIAIPADAVLPPGALPEGISFVANVAIAADGSVQRVRLRPQLIGFEKGAIQP